MRKRTFERVTFSRTLIFAPVALLLVMCFAPARAQAEDPGRGPRRDLDRRVLAAQYSHMRRFIEYLGELGLPVHPNLTRGVEEGTAKLGVGGEFFERFSRHYQ